MSSGANLTRAYSILEVKSVDEDQRVIEGVASTPEVDRMGDVVEPDGAVFKLPIPLLWQHRSDQPIGTVTHAKVTKSGIQIRAQIAKDVLPRIDEAWALIKSGLVRGLSIGFNALETAQIDGTFGLRFMKWEWLELSAVTIPANSTASIATVKQFSHSPAVVGTSHVNTPAVVGTPVVKLRPGSKMKTIQEQIKEYEATRETKRAQMEEMVKKSADGGVTFDAAQEEEYDTLAAEVEAINKHVERLAKLEKVNAASAKAVVASTPDAASASRGTTPVISVNQPALPPGIGFARLALCKTAAYLNHMPVMEIAKARYPSDQRLHAEITKATVAAGTTTDTNNATELVEPTTLASEFLEYLRAQTIIGKFGTNGVPALKRLPFNIRIPRQTTGGTGYWVGEGAPKPMTSFQFDAVTLPYTKVAAIAVITQELARFSSPSAETIVRDQLAAAVIERMDIDFIDPAKAVSSGVNPASITNGLTALSSAGTSADNIRTDVQNLLEGYLVNKLNPANVVLIMPNTLALAASLMVTTNGQPSFPALTMNGGSLQGIPVITSQYAANESSYGNLVIAVDTSSLGLADDGQVTVDVSTEASLQFLDNPTNSAATGTATTMVSLWQTNSIGLRAERFIHWVKLRSNAVFYMDDVNWGAIGSPV